jgi:hypothetical protein
VFRSIDSLRTVPVPVATRSAQLVMPREARVMLERLQAALGDFDVTAASSALADLDRVEMPDNDGDLARLRDHIDNYEYDEGRALVTRLLEQIGSSVS